MFYGIGAGQKGISRRTSTDGRKLDDVSTQLEAGSKKSSHLLALQRGMENHTKLITHKLAEAQTGYLLIHIYHYINLPDLMTSVYFVKK